MDSKQRLEGKRSAAGFLGAAAQGFSILFLIIAVWTIWILRSQPKAVDFLSYWAAAKLALSGQIPSIYSVTAHHAEEMLVAPIGGLLPFPYPPPFLLVVTPFGLFPYWLAFGLWVSISAAIFGLVVGRNGMLPYAFSHPAILANFLIGQNGLLTTSIFSAGLGTLARNQYAGGAILGLMVIKPQLALLLPFALIAGRQWKAIAGGALSAAAAIILAFLLFGWRAYEGFAKILPVYTNGMAQSLWPWNEMASTFASLRFFEVPQATALTIHALVALAAAVLVCRAWWFGLEERGPTLAAATLLVPPYLLTYDALLLVIPVIFLVQQRRHVWTVPVIWLLCFLPIAYYFGYYAGPNTVPLGALVSLWALHAPSPERALSPAPAG